MARHFSRDTVGENGMSHMWHTHGKLFEKHMSHECFVSETNNSFRLFRGGLSRCQVEMS